MLLLCGPGSGGTKASLAKEYNTTIIRERKYLQQLVASTLFSESEKSSDEDDNTTTTSTEQDSDSETNKEDEQGSKGRRPEHRAPAGAKPMRNETVRRMATQVICQSTHMFKLNKSWLEELVDQLDQVHVRLDEARTALAAGGSSRRRDEVTKILDRTNDLTTTMEEKLKSRYTKYKQNQEAFKLKV